MEQTALILIIITLLILIIIVGLLTVLIYKMFRQSNTLINPPAANTGEAPHPDISRSELHPAILERMKSLEKVKPKRADLFCPNHSEEPGETVCAICDKLFCKACIKPFKNLYFCKEHLPLIMKYDWDEAITIKTSTHDPEQGVRLYDFKKEIFEDKDIPTYIETHYKINVDQDYIETYLVMYGIKENLEDLKKLIPKHLRSSND
jgi:hypothetical protein